MESVVLRHKYFPFLSFFFFADSDDSDTEGGLGNVERVVMRPPGHSGKAKRGHLCFDSSFETGALHFNSCQIDTLKRGGQAIKPSSVHAACSEKRSESSE